VKGVAMSPRLDQIEVYQIIKDNLPLGFSVVDREGIIVDFNEAAVKITGYARDEVMGKSHHDILHGASDNESCPLLHLAIRQRKEAVETESFITKKNGDNIILSVTTFPLIDEEGAFLGGVELFRDVTAEKKMERERKNILSMFAHDMKNPVLTSGGLISRLLSGKTGKLSLKQEEYLTIIKDNLHRVESLIVNFLDFSKIETKEYKPKIEYFDFGGEIQRIVESVKIEADNKNIIINYIRPEDGPVMIHADPMMLDRVISNLLGNALKYTNANGTITIELFNRDENVLVRVTDTGIGIDEKHLPHIFDAFFRVSRDFSGAGLGLAISKTIIEAHGGRIWVNSSMNAGTSFHFILPKLNE
jgi:two-component system, OmpR family, phosphate regulon sensor histidine kinase PhoR